MATALVVLGICLATLLIKPTPADYHLRAISKLRRMHEPAGFFDYLLPNIWEWYMAGRPSPMERDKQIAEHYEWLVDLRSFETRNFYLHHQKLDDPGWRRLVALIQSAHLTDRHWGMKTVPDRPSVVTITACRKDMKTWEGIFSRFDPDELK